MPPVILYHPSYTVIHVWNPSYQPSLIGSATSTALKFTSIVDASSSHRLPAVRPCVVHLFIYCPPRCVSVCVRCPSQNYPADTWAPSPNSLSSNWAHSATLSPKLPQTPMRWGFFYVKFQVLILLWFYDSSSFIFYFFSYVMKKIHVGCRHKNQESL